ncbi:MAG TPA: hypothetical protein VGY55_24890 [Pirellulales bacterium]|jgi:hypothetical protein|nr:hypothetical protein [Pirellulales bacterium]
METPVKQYLSTTAEETALVSGARRIGELMPAVLARHGIDPLAVRERGNGRTLVVVHSANAPAGIAELLATV